MPAQDVCSQNHCGMAGNEWVVFIASGSFLRERLSWRMILAILVGKSDRTQIPPPTSLLAWEMMARQGLDLWVVRYKDEKNHHPHSLLFFETKSCPSRTGFLFLFFIRNFADPERSSVKCSPFQWRLANNVDKMALGFSLCLGMSSLFIFKYHQLLKSYERPLSCERT